MCCTDLTTEKILVEWGADSLLSVMKDKSGNRYLEYNLDTNSEEEIECYLTTEVAKEDLIGLLECKIPLYDLLKRNKYVWLDNGGPVYYRVPLEIISEKLFPIKDSCFEDNSEWKSYIEKLKKELP